MTDSILVRLKAGDDMAWYELYKRVGPGLYNYIYSIIKDREKAADLLQEAFLRLARSIKSIRKEDALKSWLYITSRNMAYDLLRKRSEVPVDERFSEQVDPREHPDDKIIRDETSHELLQALETLSLEHRTVVELRLWSDMSFAEISKVTGDSVGTLRSRYCWAIRKLREIMNKEGEAR